MLIYSYNITLHLTCSIIIYLSIYLYLYTTHIAHIIALSMVAPISVNLPQPPYQKLSKVNIGSPICGYILAPTAMEPHFSPFCTPWSPKFGGSLAARAEVCI